MKRKSCLPPSAVPPSPIIALASSRTLVVVSPGDPAFVVLFDAGANLFVLDPESFGFTLLNGALVYQGPPGRRIDVRGHATFDNSVSTDVKLGVVVDGTEMIGGGLDAEGRGLAFVPTATNVFIACDALVLLNPGQTLSLGMITGAPLQATVNDLSIVAHAV